MADTQELETKHSGTDFRHNFSLGETKCWKSLPTEPVQATSQESFRKKLDIFYFYLFEHKHWYKKAPSTHAPYFIRFLWLLGYCPGEQTKAGDLFRRSLLQTLTYCSNPQADGTTSGGAVSWWPVTDNGFIHHLPPQDSGTYVHHRFETKVF